MTFPPDLINLLLGPGGLTIGLLILVLLFIREVILPRGRLEDQKQMTRDALAVGQGAVAAIEKMADALETRNQIDIERSERR